MILKIKKISRKFGSIWSRQQFCGRSCGSCNGEYCHKPIMINANTIGQFQDVCLYVQIGKLFNAYIYVGEITKNL